MNRIANRPASFEEYAAQFPLSVRKRLRELRKAVKGAAPDAKETISYCMPAYKQNRVLVYFAAYNKHIGFYPMPRAIEAFRNELSDFGTAKGTVRFPLDRPLPSGLIRRMVKFRIEEDARRAVAKGASGPKGTADAFRD